MAPSQAVVPLAGAALAALAVAAAATLVAKGAQDLSPLVPDVLREVPLTILHCSYDGLSVLPGQELKPVQVRAPPSLEWSAASGDLFTVCMVDPDASASPNETSREFLHWLVANAPGGAEGGVEGGDVLAEYIGSGPPLHSGLHRYALLVFLQPQRLSFADEPRRNASSLLGRRFFSIQRFAETHGLQLPPAAGTFFRAQWDESVPALHRQVLGLPPPPPPSPPPS